MIQRDDYIEFDLKGIFFYILRCWKSVVAVTLAAAILLGAMQAVLGLKKQKTSNYEEQYQAYQEQLVAYDDSVSKIQTEMDILQEYIDHSVLMQMDPQNVYIAKATYHIDSGYVIIPENYYQNTDKTKILAHYYRNFLQDSSFYEEISVNHGIELQYLMELIDVPDDSSEALSFSVMHPQKDVAQSILLDIQEKLSDIHDLLEISIHEHTLTELSTSCSIYINNSLKKEQDDTQEDLLDLQDDLETAEKERDAFVKSNRPVQSSIPKVFVKWFIIGGVLGAFLTVAYLFLKAVCSNRLLSSEQLAANCDTSVLGEVICSNETLPCIPKKLNQMEGCLAENTEYNWQFIAHKVQLQCGAAKNILVCSDTNSDLSSKIAAPLSALLPDLQLTPAGNPLEDITTLHMLSGCDMVLIVVVRDKSHNKKLRKIKKLIQEHKQDTVGFIITY